MNMNMKSTLKALTKLILLLIIIQLLLSFNFFKVDDFDRQTKIINQNVVNEIEKKYNLKCIGLGASAYHLKKRGSL